MWRKAFRCWAISTWMAMTWMCSKKQFAIKLVFYFKKSKTSSRAFSLYNGSRSESLPPIPSFPNCSKGGTSKDGEFSAKTRSTCSTYRSYTFQSSPNSHILGWEHRRNEMCRADLRSRPFSIHSPRFEPASQLRIVLRRRNRELKPAALHQIAQQKRMTLAGLRNRLAKHVIVLK